MNRTSLHIYMIFRIDGLSYVAQEFQKIFENLLTYIVNYAIICALKIKLIFDKIFGDFLQNQWYL